MINIIISILIITIIVWFINKILPFTICPICAGVSLTWITLLISMNLNILSSSIYQTPTAILIGGSIIGIMYKLEKYIKIKFQLIWKTIFSSIGFYVVYNLILNNWLISLIGIILMCVTTIFFREIKSKEKLKQSKEQKEIQEKMKNCC